MKIHPGFKSNLTGIAVISHGYSDNYLLNLMIIRGFVSEFCQQLPAALTDCICPIHREMPLQEGIGAAESES
jgi:hypothetical protein